VIPFSLVLVAIGPLVNTVTVSFVLVPLTHVGVAIVTLPDSIAVFDSFAPFPIISLSINPGVEAFAVNPSVSVITHVSVTVTEFLVSLSVTFIEQPASFINPSIVIHTYPKAVAFLVNDFTTVS
jgi:hypothetical protein